MPVVGSADEEEVEGLRVSRSCLGRAVVWFCTPTLRLLADRCRENHGCVASSRLVVMFQTNYRSVTKRKTHHSDTGRHIFCVRGYLLGGVSRAAPQVHALWELKHVEVEVASAKRPVRLNDCFSSYAIPWSEEVAQMSRTHVALHSSGRRVALWWTWLEPLASVF